MKALVFTGSGGMRIIERPTPQPRDNWVLVKVLASGICGTDIEILLPQTPPNATVPGHEGVGEVAAVNGAATVKVGDRVMFDCHITCRQCDYCKAGDVIFCPDLKAIGFELDGTNAEYILMPEESLRPLPAGISTGAGVLIGDALGTPWHAVKKAGIKPGDFVTVFGVGPLGMLAVFCAAKQGAQVIAVDLNAGRLAQAPQYGAAFCLAGDAPDLVAEIVRITAGRGADACIQCTPSGAALNNGLDSLRLRGRLIQVGVCQNATINPMKQINDREITIMGSRNFNGLELDEIVAFVRANPDIESVITHRFPLSQAEEAFRTAQSGAGLKVLILPNG